MCAYSEAKTKNKNKWEIYLGYHGAYITLNDICLYRDVEGSNYIDNNNTRKEFIEKMNDFNKNEIIEVIADFIENSYEI